MTRPRTCSASDTRRPPSRQAFTLIELLVAIFIIAALIGLMMPALGHVRRSAQRVVCSGTLQQVGVAWQLYVDDHEEIWPEAVSLPSPPAAAPADEVTIMAALEPYLADPRAFACPSDDRGYFEDLGTSYEYLPGLVMGLSPTTPKVVATWARSNANVAAVLADGEPFHPTGTDPMFRQAVFHDGHVNDLFHDRMQAMMEEHAP